MLEIFISIVCLVILQTLVLLVLSREVSIILGLLMALVPHKQRFSPIMAVCCQ